MSLITFDSLLIFDEIIFILPALECVLNQHCCCCNFEIAYTPLLTFQLAGE